MGGDRHTSNPYNTSVSKLGGTDDDGGQMCLAEPALVPHTLWFSADCGRDSAQGPNAVTVSQAQPSTAGVASPQMGAVGRTPDDSQSPMSFFSGKLLSQSEVKLRYLEKSNQPATQPPTHPKWSCAAHSRSCCEKEMADGQDSTRAAVLGRGGRGLSLFLSPVTRALAH